MKVRDKIKLIAAPFTIMDSKGDPDYQIIDRYIEHLVASGVSGVFVCGTTGEGSSLTTEERKEQLEAWVYHAGNRLRVICHVGGNSVRQCRELAVHAAQTGAYAVATLSPFFFRPATAGELTAFLSEVAMVVPDLPFYYYHIPSLTHVYIPVIRLLEEVHGLIPNFAGVKYTHSDQFDMQQCIAYGSGKYEILNGFDESLICGLSLGVRSAVGSTYNYMAGVYQAIDEAFISCDMERARELQQYAVKVVGVLSRYGGAVRAGKAIMAMIGIDCGPCRLPIPPFNEDELEGLRRDLNGVGFFETGNTRE